MMPVASHQRTVVSAVEQRNALIAASLVEVLHDIADYLGLSMETVCRTFTTFREEGLIDYDTRTPVILRQPELLEAIAESS